VIASRLLLATVFAVAAVAKLTDREGTGEAVEAFGAPDRLAPVVALTLPAAAVQHPTGSRENAYSSAPHARRARVPTG
jgi:hypothetical protein